MVDRRMVWKETQSAISHFNSHKLTELCQISLDEAKERVQALRAELIRYPFDRKRCELNNNIIYNLEWYIHWRVDLYRPAANTMRKMEKTLRPPHGDGWLQPGCTQLPSSI